MGKFSKSKKLNPIIFVHGAWANHITYFKQLEYFSKYTECYALDLLGHGKSDKPKIEYTVDNFTEILHAFIVNLKIPNPVLVGHSMGGLIIQNIAIKYPEIPAKLVIDCSGAGSFGISLKIPYFFSLFIKYGLHLINYQIFCQINDKIAATKKIPELKDTHLEGRMAKSCSKYAIMSEIYHMFFFDISEQVSTIKCPILFISGTKDLFKNQKNLYESLPNAEVRIQQNGDHNLHFKGEINPWILEFIKK
jgi:pimeloyl-ACP methyl ester carboxylesterase